MSAPKHRAAQPRQILAAQVAALRDQGLFGTTIAERLGISRSYAYDLIKDPTGTSERARKERYCGTCVTCGARTSYSHSGKPSLRCEPCGKVYLHETYGVWSRDHVIAAINAWADEHGGVPPAATDWNPSQAIKIGHPEKAAKFHRDGAWPHTTTVQDYFGSWNAALKAAGFEPRLPGHYGREGEGLAERVDVAAMYESGLSAYRIAGDLGVSDKTVRAALRKQGARMRSHSEAMRLAADRRAA